MAQQTFPVSGRRPKVLITRLEGNLVVQPWERQEISVSTEGDAEVLHQENDTITITDCKGDLSLWIPSIRGIVFPLVTDIIGTALSRSATIEGAGNVELKDVGGNVALRKIYGNVELANVSEVAELNAIGGNLHAVNMPVLRAQQGIGGNASLLDVRKQEIDAIGGNLMITGADTATCTAVGGNLDIERVATSVHCDTVGGNCEVYKSPEAQISVHTVGGNFYTDGAAVIQSSIVGGNLKANLTMPAGSQSKLHIGGNATVTLPENANVSVHATVGGSASGPSGVYRRSGGFVSLVYGDGSARLHLTVGGNLKLLGSTEARVSGPGEAWQDFGASWSEFGEAWSDFGREMGREMRKMGRELSREFRRSFRY